jgi:hypothetical protein
VYAPGHLAVGARRVEVCAHDGDVVGRCQFAAQFERINLRTRLMAGQEVVNRVQDAQILIMASCSRFMSDRPIHQVP